MSRIAVIGAGGFGRECLDIIEACNSCGQGKYDVIGLFDDAPSELNASRLAERGYSIRGGIESIFSQDKDLRFVVGIGDPDIRKMVTEKCLGLGLAPLTIIHPSATIGSQVSIGEGSVICAQAAIATNVQIGEFSHLNANSTIGHDAVISNFVSINPGAVISGEVIINSGTLIGANATVLQGVEIGEGAIVGASACVTRTVSSGVTVVGIPARVAANHR